MIIHCLYDELLPVSTLSTLFHPKNHNKHPDDQIERLAQILEYQGVRYPVKVSRLSGKITSGHGRVLAAIRNGWPQFPVNYQDYADDQQEYADLQADNAIASWSELDLSQINLDLGDLGPDFDLDLLGIKDFVLEPAEKFEPQCDEDEIPEPKESICKLGDIWKLGNHRLLCDDSTSIDSVEKLMNGQKADMVFTSPPYNADTHLNYGNGKNKPLYENNFDSKTSQDYIAFCHKVLNNIFLVTEGFVFWNVSYNSKSRFEYIKSIYPFIERLWETIVWKKTGMPIPSGLTRNCEFIFCFKNGAKKKHLNKKFETEFNFWDISNIGSQTKEHRACFPVGLPQKAIELVCESDDLIYEPFGGSGTTLIACEKTNRKCFMMELDPYYTSIIIERWCKYTGKEAYLINEDGTQTAWSEIKAVVK